ncbi:uncharacterized protein LOC132644013 [Lycium barbarum]|uniref:uncharacterized protein LOC132644013 n=1 Tax=Lycium barbarum TaxID=112863 RepID=UPI00293E755E|nr:uncharacterized protein LOC132644013 [Lycium barbarum]
MLSVLGVVKYSKVLKKKVINLEPIAEEEEAQSDMPTIVDGVQTEAPIVEKFVNIPKSSKMTSLSSDTGKQTVGEEDGRCQVSEIYDKLKQLSMNFPFLDAVKEMPGFAIQKKGDQGALTIPYSTGHHDFARTFYDNGASINLMPLAIYKQSGLGMPRPMTMQLQMADRSIKRTVGVVNDVLVRVGDFLLLVDFVILDCAVDWDIPIILGRPFLSTGRALMDSKKNEIKLFVNDEEVTFQATMEFKMEIECLGEALAAILVNFDADDIEGYVETVNSLVGLGSYYYQPKKLDLDLENRTTPPLKPFIVEPPKLELKQLPTHLKYEFLGPDNTLPVVVSALLNEE